LSYKEAIKDYAAKNVGKKVLSSYVRKIIKKYFLNILDFVMFVVFVNFLKFDVYSDFSF